MHHADHQEFRGTHAGAVRLPAHSLTVALLPPAILLPCVFKLGSQKGSYAYYTVIALMAALIGVLNVSDVSGNQIEAALSFLAPSPFSILLLPLAAAILFFLSWPLSARIYEKKDF